MNVKSQDSVEPDRLTRRSPLYREMIRLGAQWARMGECAVVARLGDTQQENLAATHLAIADLFALPRIGFKGSGTNEWLSFSGLELPKEPNRSTIAKDGTHVVRLGPSEFLLCSGLSGQSQSIARLEQPTESVPAGIYRVDRSESNFCIALCGLMSADLLSRVCAIDLRPEQFASSFVAQTIVAGISAVVMRVDHGSTLGYFLMGDVAATEYIWRVLSDALAEFNGIPVGLNALRVLGEPVDSNI